MKFLKKYWLVKYLFSFYLHAILAVLQRGYRNRKELGIYAEWKASIVKMCEKRAIAKVIKRVKRYN